MTCRFTPLPGGFAVSCSRSRGTVLPCEVCKARPHMVFCGYRLRGAKQGGTCDRAMCLGCAVAIGPVHMCAAHAKVTNAELDEWGAQR